MNAVFLVAIVAVIVIAIAATSIAASKRKDVLRALADELAGTAGSNRVDGTIDGVAVSLVYETRGSGSSSESWTYLEAALPPGYPLALNVDRHGWFDRGKIERGEMVDVTVGDAAFDDAFRVEGAPAEVVRGMLTADVRGFLLEHTRVEVRTLAGPVLRVAVRTWLTERDRARDALQRVARLAASLRPVTLGLDARHAMTTTGDAYRAMPSDRPLQDARAARAEEVARVEAMRARRRGREGAIAAAVFALVVVGFGFLAVAMFLD